MIENIAAGRTRDVLETSDGIVFATDADSIVKYTPEGLQDAERRLDGGSRGLAVARNEVPFGRDFLPGGGVVGASGDEEGSGAAIISAVATGLGSWFAHVEAGDMASGADFGVVELSTASGVVFNDLDGDGLRGAVEPGLDGWVVYVDLDDDGERDGIEPFATTSGGGLYTITGIRPGMHTLRQELQADWTPTAPADGALQVNFVAGSAIANLIFGNQACPADWLFVFGDTLYMFGDELANQAFVTSDLDGRLRVSDDSLCFHEFTGIRRIVADMNGGDDRVTVLGPVAGMAAPIDLGIRTELGNDDVRIENWRGALSVDLGERDDEADVAYVGGGSPDPGAVQLNLAARAGNDDVNLTASEVFTVACLANCLHKLLRNDWPQIRLRCGSRSGTEPSQESAHEKRYG